MKSVSQRMQWRTRPPQDSGKKTSLVAVHCVTSGAAKPPHVPGRHVLGKTLPRTHGFDENLSLTTTMFCLKGHRTFNRNSFL